MTKKMVELNDLDLGGVLGGAGFSALKVAALKVADVSALKVAALKVADLSALKVAALKVAALKVAG